MSTDGSSGAVPLARYAPYRRAGDLVILSGIIAVDPVARKVVTGYGDLHEDVRQAAGETGEMSVDAKDGPIQAQSWYIMELIERTLKAAGGTLEDVVHLVQYFTDLNEYPGYNRVRSQFFDDPPASTVVGVSELLPNKLTRVEVQATAFIPRS